MSLHADDFIIQETRTIIRFDGPKFRNERQKRGLSQGTIARRAGITTSHICNIEKGVGRPSREVAERMVAALDYIEGEK